MRLLTSKTVAFCAGGAHNDKTIRYVRQLANKVTTTLADRFASCKLGDVIRYCREQGLIQASERLSSHLDRKPREEEYDDEQHAEEKGDWLADTFFDMHGAEVEHYCRFLNESTPYSTQHGVKGEQYDDVLVVFDDTEAAWNNYSFAKMLTPGVAGEPRDRQNDRSRKLAYVCFSRAVRNLRILLFTPEPDSAKEELTKKGLFQESQVTILA